MTPSGMIAIRYTGDSRRSEAPITGKGKEWWPGELRCVPLARGSQLLAAGLGWERDEDEDDLVAVTAAQTSAGAVGVAGVTATGGMVGPDGSPVSGGFGLPCGAAIARYGTAPWQSGSTVTTDFTMVQSWRIPMDISAFRLGFENVSPSQLPAITLAKYALCGAAGNTSTQAIDATANYHSSSPAAVTFDGNAGFTPGLRKSSTRPSAIQWSDYIPVSGADEGKTLAFRMLVPAAASWNYPYHALAFSAYSTYLAQVINAVAAKTNTVDYVTANNSWALNSSNMDGNLVVPYVEWIAKSSAKSVLSVAHFGDSITTGTAQSGDPSIQPSQLACEALSTTNVKLVPMGRGFGGRKTDEVYGLFLRYIADCTSPPKIVVWQVSSQNSATSTANVQSTEGYINEVRRLCRQIGAVCVLQTAAPINGNSMNADNARKAVNAAARYSGEIIIDTDATLTDGGSPAAYKSAYGSGAHPTIQAYADDLTNQWIPALRAACARFGLSV